MKKYEVEKILNLDGKGEWAVVKLEEQKDGEILRIQLKVYEDEMEAICINMGFHRMRSKDIDIEI